MVLHNPIWHCTHYATENHFESSFVYPLSAWVIYNFAPLNKVYVILGIKSRVLCMLVKLSTNWVTFLRPRNPSPPPPTNLFTMCAQACVEAGRQHSSIGYFLKVYRFWGSNSVRRFTASTFTYKAILLAQEILICQQKLARGRKGWTPPILTSDLWGPSFLRSQDYTIALSSRTAVNIPTVAVTSEVNWPKAKKEGIPP